MCGEALLEHMNYKRASLWLRSKPSESAGMYKRGIVLFYSTEVFPCFFLSCKANAKVYLAKTGHGLHSS